MKNLSFKSTKIRLTVLLVLPVIVGLFLLFSHSNQETPLNWEEWETGCTSIMVGREATTDGSVITAHSCDGNYRTWLNIVPHKKHPEGATNKIYYGQSQ